jgi:cytochrome b561
MQSVQQYNKITIFLHWFMLLLIVGVYATMEIKGFFPKGSETRELLKHWHFMLGLAVLALVVLRLTARVIFSRPAITPTPNKTQELAAKVMQFTLYVFMLAMPIAGWLILSAYGKSIPFFGLELPALIEVNKELAHQIKEIHETVAVVGYVLIALHASAALYHHYFMKDDTLKRMLP